MTEYQSYGVNLSPFQARKIVTACKKHVDVSIRLTKDDLRGDKNLPLTQTQIKWINKAIKAQTGIDLSLSATQLAHMEKSGGILPLLTLLPLIFGGLGAAGGLTTGISSAVSSANSAQAQRAAQIELERHNREVEKQLKSGSGVVSNTVGKIPVIGRFLQPILQKFGLGINDCNQIKNGHCVCIGKGLYMKSYGDGIFLGPQGSDLFLGQER